MNYWYAKASDRRMAIVDVKMHYCYNGIDYIVQCQPTPLAELNKTVETLHDTLDEASDHAKEILKMVPSSELKNCLKMALKSISTAKSITSQTCTATGTANLAAIISPQPAVVASSHPVSSHSCPPDSSAKRKAEMVSTPPDQEPGSTQPSVIVIAPEDAPEGTPAKQQKLGYMYTNECPCGKIFKDRITLDKHIEADHTQSGVWKCCKCSNTYTKRGTMFKHFRNAHDLTRLHHWCKIGSCEYGHDNLTTLKKHCQDCHNIESDVKCQKCGKVFSQRNKLRDHEIICKTEFKAFNCEQCDKGYRSSCRLREHMQNDHSGPGEQPLMIPCSVLDCPKHYKSRTAMKKHLRDKHGYVTK